MRIPFSGIQIRDFYETGKTALWVYPQDNQDLGRQFGKHIRANEIQYRGFRVGTSTSPDILTLTHMADALKAEAKQGKLPKITTELQTLVRQLLARVFFDGPAIDTAQANRKRIFQLRDDSFGTVTDRFREQQRVLHRVINKGALRYDDKTFTLLLEHHASPDHDDDAGL